MLAARVEQKNGFAGSLHELCSLQKTLVHLIRGVRALPLARRQTGESEQALARFLPAVGDGAVLEPPFADFSLQVRPGPNFAKALEAADQVISLAPTQLWLYMNRADALVFLDREAEALSSELGSSRGSVSSRRHRRETKPRGSRARPCWLRTGARAGSSPPRSCRPIGRRHRSLPARRSAEPC